MTSLAIAGGLWAVGAARAQTAPTQLPNPMDLGVIMEELAFEAADTDGDNLVEEAEFVRDAAAAFSGLDRNRDGRLTPDELNPNDPAKFQRIDSDGDGALTFNEVMTYKMKAFRAADSNKDGALSFDEMLKSVGAEVGNR